jgi:serine/threonine protein kinase
MERSATNYERFGHYRVLEKLGEGGFALVYKVGDAQGRILAAKVLRAELVARSAKVVEFFQREIDVHAVNEAVFERELRAISAAKAAVSCRT